MAYLSREALKAMGFKHLGRNVKVSDRTSIYNPEQIAIGNDSRIDDFCVVSGNITIGRNVYIGPQSLIAGGIPGVIFEDFCTLAYGVKVFSQSDDYSGGSLTNPTVSREFKQETFAAVHLGRHVIIGAGSIVFPGVSIAEGCSIGAMTLVNRSTQPWGIYVGNPARRFKERRRDLLKYEQELLARERQIDSI